MFNVVEAVASHRHLFPKVHVLCVLLHAYAKALDKSNVPLMFPCPTALHFTPQVHAFVPFQTSLPGLLCWAGPKWKADAVVFQPTHLPGRLVCHKTIFEPPHKCWCGKSANRVMTSGLGDMLALPLEQASLIHSMTKSGCMAKVCMQLHV